MTFFLKRTLLIICIISLIFTSIAFASDINVISKAYSLIHNNKSTKTNALIFNGEIYVNLSDFSNTIGLTTNISGDAISLVSTPSTNGLLEESSGNLYSGELHNGVPNGYGTRYLKDGGKYEGEWSKGVYEGNGTLILPNGNIYVGSFSKGFIHGEGKMFYLDGSYYKGHYDYGIQQGFGSFYVNSDNKYEGYWSNGMRNGKGKAYINGRYKKGLWENNQLIKMLPESSFDF